MAESSSPVILHIESFVSSDSSTAQQKASLDKIVALVSKETLTVDALVTELELYLTTTDVVLRGRGLTLLAEVLARLSTKKLSQVTIKSLAEFFSAKLADWQVVSGALLGCLSLLRRRRDLGAVSTSHAISIAQSFLQNLQVQVLAQHDRLLCFQLLQCLLDFYPEDIASSLGEDLIYGVCAAIDDEKDPHCLLLTFHIVETLGRLFPDPSGPLATFAQDLFDILSRYFPIYFTHPSKDDVVVKRDDLANALMLAFSLNPFFEPFSVPLLLEKLSSSLPSAKIDSIRCLSNCIIHYGPERMMKHSKLIWYSLKEVIFSYSSAEYLVNPLEESRDKDSQENCMCREAVDCLQMAISYLKIPDSSFLGWIVEDEEFDSSFLTVAGEGSYEIILKENKRQMYAVGSILASSAKVSHDCCDIVFKRYFIRIMGILGVSSVGTENIDLRRLKFGALFLSVEILCSCLKLVQSSDGLLREPESYRNTWQSTLEDLQKPLVDFFASVVSNYDSVAGSKQYSFENVHHALKGLKTLAMFPRYFIRTSDMVYECIITILTTKLLSKYEDSSHWMFLLKALVELGQSLETFPDSPREACFRSCVLERIMSELRGDDCDRFFTHKLEAVYSIGSSRPNFMAPVLKELEALTFLRLMESIEDASSKSATNLVYMLDCYSSQVLQWCMETGYFQESAFHFAIELWNQMEGIVLSNCPLRPTQEVIDALVRAMKITVALCKEQHQSQILEMAFKMVKLTVFPSYDYSIPVKSLKLNITHICPDSFEFTRGQEIMFSLFVSILIGFRPHTTITNVRIILTWLMISFFKGLPIAVQGLGSVVNKWPRESDKPLSGSCSLDEALDFILCESLYAPSTRFLSPKSSSICGLGKNPSDVGILRDMSLTKWVSVLAWVGKGLLMRGNERMKDVIMLMLKYLVSTNQIAVEQLGSDELLDINGCADNILARSAADMFEVLLSDSDVVLNKKFHAVITPLYKQKFFTIITPLLLSCISEANLTSRNYLYRALGHVICNTPQAALIPEAKRLILPLVEGLSFLGADTMNENLVYKLLLVLSGFLMDDTGKEAILENACKIISCVLGLTCYPHLMHVRETAIQCLIAFSDLPYQRIYPVRCQVIESMTKVLDDRKRIVRLEAVKCLHTWTSLT